MSSSCGWVTIRSFSLSHSDRGDLILVPAETCLIYQVISGSSVRRKLSQSSTFSEQSFRTDGRVQAPSIVE